MNQSNLISTQKYWEEKLSKRQLKKYLKEVFKDLVDPLLNQIEQTEYSKPEDKQEDYKSVELILDILGLLALRPRLGLNACIEMLLDKGNLANSIEQILSIVKYGSNTYWELEINRDKLYLNQLYQPTEDVINRIKEFQYLIPMLVSPLITNENNNNRGSGYLTIGSDSLILGGVHHSRDIDSTILDRYNQIPLELNQELMMLVRNNWKSLNEPSKEDLDYKTKLKAFEDYEKQVYFTSAILINNGNKFYLTHKYDKRGRVYSCGYSVNTQGNSYAKASINLANKQLVTDTINSF